MGQSVGTGSWPWRLTSFRVVLCPKAQAFQEGKKEEQSCGCWRSSRLEDGRGAFPEPPGSLEEEWRIVSEGLSSGRAEGRWRRKAASVQSLRVWSCCRRSVASEEGPSWLSSSLGAFPSVPGESCVRSGGLDGDRAGARGAARSRDRRSRLPAGRSTLDARRSTPDAQRAGGGRPGRGSGGKWPGLVSGPGLGVSVRGPTARGRRLSRDPEGRERVNERARVKERERERERD